MEATKENKLLNFNDYRNKLDNISLICLGSFSLTRHPSTPNSFLKFLTTWLHYFIPFRVCLDISYYWKLKTYCCKYYSKIIIKYVNSAVGPSFKAKFTEFRTCKPVNSAWDPLCKTPSANMLKFQCNPNTHLSNLFSTP